jgi:hypothetical protein
LAPGPEATAAAPDASGLAPCTGTGPVKSSVVRKVPLGRVRASVSAPAELFLDWPSPSAVDGIRRPLQRSPAVPGGATRIPCRAVFPLRCPSRATGQESNGRLRVGLPVAVDNRTGPSVPCRSRSRSSVRPARHQRAPSRWERTTTGTATASCGAPSGVACTACRGDRNDRQVTARRSLREEVRKGAQGQAQRTQGEGAGCGADAAADAPEKAGRLTASSGPPAPGRCSIGAGIANLPRTAAASVSGHPDQADGTFDRPGPDRLRRPAPVLYMQPFGDERNRLLAARASGQRDDDSRRR